MQIKKLLLLLSTLAFLAGCGPVKLPDIQAYQLTNIPMPIHKRPHHTTLLVMQPQAIPMYSSTQMAYSRNLFQIAYFAKNRWAETPAAMLQKLTVQSLQNTHYYHAVVASPFAGQYDYALNLQLLDLHQDFTHDPSWVHLTVRAVIVRAGTNRVVAVKQFTVVERTPENTPFGGVVAANWAIGKILKQLTAFCLHKT